MNEDGEPVLVPYVVEPVARVDIKFGKGADPAPAKTTKTEKMALRALAEAVRQNFIAEGGLKYAAAADWSAEFNDVFDGEGDAARKAFKRAVGSLTGKGLIETPNRDFYRLL